MGEYDCLRDIAPGTHRLITTGNDRKPAFKTVAVKYTISTGAGIEEKTYTATVPMANYDKIKYIVENPTVPRESKIAVLEWAKNPGVKLKRNPVKDYEKIMNCDLPEKQKLLENIKNLTSIIRETENLPSLERSEKLRAGLATGFLGYAGGTFAVSAAGVSTLAGFGILIGITATAVALPVMGTGVYFDNKIDNNNAKIQEDTFACFNLYKELLYKLDSAANSKTNPIMSPDFAVFLNYAFSQKI